MAAGDRTKLIRDRCRAFYGLVNGSIPNSINLDLYIYDTIDAIQKRIAEETLCLEVEANLSIADSIAAEPSGFYRLKFVELPSSSTNFIPDEVDPLEFDHLTRTAVDSPLGYYWFKRWDGNIEFFPRPGTATWSIHYYAVPTTNVSASVDPETPSIFDKAIEYGVLADVAPTTAKPAAGGVYADMYGREFERARSAYRRTKTVGLSIYQDDYK